jgi:hypothetical protein
LASAISFLAAAAKASPSMAARYERAEFPFLPGDLSIEGANLLRNRADRIDQSSPRLITQLEPRDLRGDIHARARDPALESQRFLRFAVLRKRAILLQLPPLSESATVARADSLDSFERQS